MTLLSCLSAKQSNNKQADGYLFDPSESLNVSLKQYETNNSLQVPDDHIVKNSIQQPEFIAELKKSLAVGSQNIKKKPKAPKRQGIIYYCDNDLDYIKVCDEINPDDSGFVGSYTYEPIRCFPIYGKVKTLRGSYEDEILKFTAKGDLSYEGYPVSDSTDPTGATYSYDSKGRLCRFEVGGCLNSVLSPPLSPSIHGQETFEYDSRGNFALREYTQMMWSNCRMKSIYSYKYDSRNNITEKVVRTKNEFSPDDESVAYYYYEYDAKNNLTQEEQLDSDRRLVYRYNYKYDSQRNIVEVTLSGFSGMKSKRLFHYSANGVLLLSEHYGEDYNLTSYTLYKYDERGNMVEKSQFNSFQNLQKQSMYKYDRVGNVVEHFDNESYMYLDDNTLKIKITYYK